MKKILFFTLIFACIILKTNAQVGINTMNPNATLDVSPTNTNGTTAEGIIAPRLSLQQVISKDAQYTNNQTGSIIFINDITGATDTKTINIKQIGYYYFDGTLWQPFHGGGWSLTGNTGIDPAINYLGTLDDNDLVFVRNGIRAGWLTGSTGDAANNTAFGVNALTNTPHGLQNVAIGSLALTAAKTIASASNTAVGYSALSSMSLGAGNTAIGTNAGSNLSWGNNNIAIGVNTPLPTATTSSAMNIGNLLFGTGVGINPDYLSGKIGINIVNPATTLDIHGDLTIDSAAVASTNVSYLVRNNATGLVGVAPQTILNFTIAAGDSVSVNVPPSLFYPSTGDFIVTSSNPCGRYLTALFNVVVSHPTDFGLPLVYINSMARQVVGVVTKYSDFRYEVKFPGVIGCGAGSIDGGSTMFDFTIDTGNPGIMKLINNGDVNRDYTISITEII